MQRLAERQRQFAAALLDPELPPPSGLIGPDGEPSPRRFGVYRNNVVAGLTEALSDAFPAVCRIVGVEFFRAMARPFVISRPPDTPIMLEYGARFPDFIRGFAPAASLPYLADVASIERAWMEAYHALEAAPIAPAAFAGIEPGRFSDLRLLLHPSARVVRSRFPAVTIWRMNVDDGAPAPVGLAAGGEDALIVRPRADVEVRSLPHGGAEFARALADGMSVAEALEAALADDPRFDLPANLSGLMQAGAFVGYRFARSARSRKKARRA